MAKAKKEIRKSCNKKYPEGHFMGIGIAIGLPFGIPISVATDNFGLMGIGVAIGVAIGATMEKKAKKEGKIRPLTKEERKRKKLAVWLGLITMLLGLGAFLFFLMMR